MEQDVLQNQWNPARGVKCQEHLRVPAGVDTHISGAGGGGKNTDGIGFKTRVPVRALGSTSM